MSWMNPKHTISVEELPADEPRYGRWKTVLSRGPVLWVSEDQVCKIISKVGNDTQGWRYVVEYKFVEGNERFFPACFHIEPATEAEWEAQEPTVYPHHAWDRRDKEYAELPASYISITSGDWYEVYTDNPNDFHVKEAFPTRTEMGALQDFCHSQGYEFCTERHIIKCLTELGWKLKRVGRRY